LQHPYTTVCGQYCIFYIIQRCNGLSFEKIIDLFSDKEFLMNDTVVNAAVEGIFDIDLNVINKNFISNQIVKSFEENNFNFKKPFKIDINSLI